MILQINICFGGVFLGLRFRFMFSFKLEGTVTFPDSNIVSAHIRPTSGTFHMYKMLSGLFSRVIVDILWFPWMLILSMREFSVTDTSGFSLNIFIGQLRLWIQIHMAIFLFRYNRLPQYWRDYPFLLLNKIVFSTKTWEPFCPRLDYVQVTSMVKGLNVGSGCPSVLDISVLL